MDLDHVTILPIVAGTYLESGIPLQALTKTISSEDYYQYAFLVCLNHIWGILSACFGPGGVQILTFCIKICLGPSKIGRNDRPTTPRPPHIFVHLNIHTPIDHLSPWFLPPRGRVLCTVLVTNPWAEPPSLTEFHSIDNMNFKTNCSEIT